MRTDFYPFQLEREMSVWEHRVRYNISESGVKPISIDELVGDDEDFKQELLSIALNYPQANGLDELREQIAGMYPGATSDNVVVTTGAAQANFTSVMTMLDPGDRILVMLPNYMQIYGIAMNYALDVHSFNLKEELDWSLDVDEFDQLASNAYNLIAVCNPNNPTGHIMTDAEMQAVVGAAERSGAWILADEVYAGAEHNRDEVTPSFWGRYERVIAVGSLSKAYAMPGLRLGWIVAPKETATQIWARQDYITICTTILANKIAAYALTPEVRPRVIERTRQYVRRGYQNFENWCHKHNDLISLTPPEAAAIAFVRYNKEINSSELVKRLVEKHDTYVVPGDNFGMDHHLRISYGLPDEYVNAALDNITDILMNSQ